MNTPRRIVPALVLIGTAWAAQARQPDADLQTGSEVVLSRPDLPLRANQRVLPTGWECHTYRVQKLEGPWLYVSSDNLAGWVRNDQVVPLDRAEEHLTGLIAKEPEADWTYLWRAEVRAHRDQLEPALEDLDEAVRRNPRDPLALAHRGNVLTALGQADRALADYDEAVRLSPGDPSLYARRARAWHAKGVGEKAEADLDEAIRLKPDDPEAYAVRGGIRRDAGSTDEALADYDEAIRLNPRNASSFVGRARVRLDRGQQDWAMADLHEAVRLNPALGEAYTVRGATRDALGDHTGAAADHAEAARLAPADPEALNGLAWHLATCPEVKSRDGRRAVEVATRLNEMTAFENFLYLDTLAAACAEDAQFDKAVEWQTKALELAPTDHAERPAMEDRLESYKARRPYRMD